MIAFTRGVPPPESFPAEQLAECARSVLQNDAERVLQYGNAAGYLPLREWIAGECQVSPEQVLIGQGSLQLLDTLVRVSIIPDDCMFVEQPTYDRALTIFRRTGAKLFGINLKNGVLDLQELEAKLADGILPRFIYLIPDFQNPSGALMPLEHRLHLVELARTHGFYLIEDGPYRKLRYKGQAIPTLFELAPEQVIHMSSFSKLISPGLRVGFMLLPPELILKVSKFAEDTYINSSYLNQALAFNFIERGWLQEQIDFLRDIYSVRLNAILDELRKGFREMGTWVEPQGGFFVGLNLDAAHELSTKEEIHQAGLVLTDSQGFFVEGGERFIRLPFCALTPEQIREGMARLHHLLEV